MNAKKAKERTKASIQFTPEYKKIQVAIFDACMTGEFSLIWTGFINEKIAIYLEILGFRLDRDFSPGEVIENQEVIIDWE